MQYAKEQFVKSLRAYADAIETSEEHYNAWGKDQMIIDEDFHQEDITETSYIRHHLAALEAAISFFRRHYL